MIHDILRRCVTGSILDSSHVVYSADHLAGSNEDEKVSSSGILIVEDDFLIATEIEASLTEAGFELAGIARTAEEALQLAASERPALAIMDIRLAGSRDGVDAALDLYRDWGIRCIFATAHTDEDVTRRAQPAQPLAWLQKPYSKAVLIAAVRGALRQGTN